MQVQGPKDLGHPLPLSGLEEEQLGLEPAPIWDVGTAGSDFTHYATMLASRLYLFFFNKDLFVHLFERQSYTERQRERERERETERDTERDGEREREKEKEVFHLMVHSPVGHNIWSWANPKPGARSFFWVSHAGAGAQGLGPSSTAFPGHSRELDWKRSSWD